MPIPLLAHTFLRDAILRLAAYKIFNLRDGVGPIHHMETEGSKTDENHRFGYLERGSNISPSSSIFSTS